MRQDFVSIIIPAYNEEEKIADCIRSLVNLHYPKELYEIIVVNNGSTDATERIVKSFPSVKYLYLSRPNVSQARNMAVSAAQGELIASIDADATANTEWLSRLVAAFDDPDVGVVGGPCMADPENASEFEQITFNECNVARREFLDLLPPTRLWFFPKFTTANGMFRRTAFNAVGGFDTGPIGRLEDMEFSFRLSLAGYALRYEPGAIVYHRFCSDLKELFFKGVRNTCGYLRLVYLYKGLFGRPKRIYESPGVVLLKSLYYGGAFVVAGCLRAPERTKRKNAALFLTYLGGFIGGFFNAVWMSFYGRSMYESSLAKKSILRYKSRPRAPLWWFDTDGNVVLFDGNRAFFRVLNETASFIWLRLVSGHDRKALKEELAQHFDCPKETAGLDVDLFLRELAEENFVKDGTVLAETFYYEPDLYKAIEQFA